MTETTDEIARNALYNELLDFFSSIQGHRHATPEIIARTMADEFAVTFERTMNEHGVPLRRYVLRGAWEVDPEAIGRD